MMNVDLKSDNLAAFIHDWDYCLIGMKTIPPPEIMESLSLEQLARCGHKKEQLALYELGITQQGKQRDYDVLVHILRAHSESRRR
eukprot:8844459-Karenia_brevis.AAC.1